MRKLTLLCTLMFTSGIAATAQRTGEETPVNPFEIDGDWYKANLHTHTTVSDGSVEPGERVREYREGGYDILALTDHEKTHDVTPYNTEDFLVISGMETHPKMTDGRAYHFVCLDVPHGLAFEAGETAAERMAKLDELDAPWIIAHPYWCGFNVGDLLPFKGAMAVEVYNHVCAGCGRAHSSVHWDDMLQTGWRLPAIAVDDVHGPASTAMAGWTMVKAPSLAKDDIMAALKSGAYYASCGPVIEDARIEEGVLKVTCSPVREIRFISVPPVGRIIRADGEPLTAAEYALPENAPYARVEIIDAEGRHAWTNPVYK